MQDLNDKITGGTLTAAEWNEMPSELQNIIEALGLALSSGDLNQLGKAIVDYASAGTFYTETGVANAYVATVIGAKQGLHVLSAVTDGATVRFRPGNKNTLASTLNVNSLGVKDIVRENGDALSLGDLDTTRDVTVRWDEAADDWRVLNSSLLGSSAYPERPQEVLSGQLYRSSNSVVQLLPSSGGSVVVGIDDKVLKKTGNLSWDMVTDLDIGETSSTAYYLYVRDDGGVLDEQISATAPDLPWGTKPGYKNGDATRRCVGDIWNGPGGDFSEVTWGPGGEVLIRNTSTDHEHNLGITGPTAWTVEAVNVPLTATAIRLLWFLEGNNTVAALGADNTTIPLPGSESGILSSGMQNALMFALNHATTVHYESQSGVIPIDDMTAPAFSWGIIGSPNATANEVKITGWRSLYAPK